MLSPNTILQNRYRIVRPLGKGGMGQVYEAIDDTVDSIVAIKETFANTDKLRNAFEQEAKVLASLRHPALPRVTHHFFHGDGQFLVMDFVGGLNLAQLLDLRGLPFGYKAVLPWADKLLDALAYLHLDGVASSRRQRESIIHRDIKPANIKVTDEEEVYLLDFGLAKAAPGQETSSVHGFTAAYASLEQLNNSGTTAASDLYSLGASLYQLVTGDLPVPASKRDENIETTGHDPLVPAHQSNSKVPVALSAIISQAMALKRKDRFASATEMRDALRAAGFTIEHDRKKTLEAPTRPKDKAHTVIKPTEPAVDSGGRAMDRRQRVGADDGYVKTLTTPPPFVGPPPAAQLPGIFVSYRREDSSGHAGRLFDTLVDRFGKERIFMDIDTIEPGEDYVKVIEDAVGSCDILIAMIGRSWLSSSDETSRRLDNPNDFVRLEITTALDRDIRVIPILVQGAKMPKPRELPDDLSRLSRRNALELSDLRWRHDVQQLISILERTLTRREEERRLEEAEERKRRAEEEARRRRAEEEATQAAEAQRQRREEQAQKQREEEEVKRRQAAEEAEQRAAEEARKRAEEERLQKEAEARRLAEEEAARVHAAERQHREAQERKQREEEEAKRRRVAEEAARRAADQATRRTEKAEKLTEKQLLREEPERQHTAASKQGLRWTNKKPLMIVAPLVVLIIGVALVWRLVSHRGNPSTNPVPPAGMVYVPGGEFRMGRDDGDEYEKPMHKEIVKEFFIDRYEVTRADYKKCVDEQKCPLPNGWINGSYSEGTARQPVAGVTWEAANAYATWAGKRLPTEEEWEFAARGQDGRLYPWGKNWVKGFANANGASGGFADVGTYKGESPYGTFDMVGNVWEWTATDLKAYVGGMLPAQVKDNVKVIRGGNYKSDVNSATTTYRWWLLPVGDASQYTTTGFRCVKDVDAASPAQ